MGAVRVAAVGILVVAGSLEAYQQLDASGRIPHTNETDITAEPGWLNGESKKCFSFPMGRERDVTLDIHCDAGPPHHINVKFWGMRNRHDQRAQNGVTWKCVKNADSFVCYDLD